MFMSDSVLNSQISDQNIFEFGDDQLTFIRDFLEDPKFPNFSKLKNSYQSIISELKELIEEKLQLEYPNSEEIIDRELEPFFSTKNCRRINKLRG